MLSPTTSTSSRTAADQPEPEHERARAPHAGGVRGSGDGGAHGARWQDCQPWTFSAPAVMSGTYSSIAHGTLSGVATETAMPSCGSSIGT